MDYIITNVRFLPVSFFPEPLTAASWSSVFLRSTLKYDA
jgi:hypothetical protein